MEEIDPMTTEHPDARMRVSRRGFLRAGGVTAAAAAVGASAAAPIFSRRASAQQAWDMEVDFVVGGSGGAAFAAAISAKAFGMDVVMLEKGTYVGGTTLQSGGGMWIPNNGPMADNGVEDDRDEVVAYMARYSFPHLYDPESPTLGLSDHDYAMLTTYFDEAWPAMKHIQDTGAVTWMSSFGYGFDFQQVQIDYMPEYEELSNPQAGRTLMMRNEDGTLAYGATMIQAYDDWCEANDVPRLLSHRVDAILTNDAGQVVGVTVTDTNGGSEREKTIRARKGVFFGTGGFNRNPDMMRHLMPAPYYGGCSAPTNEGDFLRIAAGAGAKLGNLHQVWRNESVFEQAVANSGAYNCTWFLNGDSFLMVNKEGKRFVNEKDNYQDRPMAHHVWDSTFGDWKNRLGIYVYDQRVQDNWGGNFPIPADPATAPYVVTGETLEELGAAIRERFEALRSKTGNVSLHDDFASNLVAEVEKFNDYARDGVDPDFHRGESRYNTLVPFGPTAETATITAYPAEDQPTPAMYPLADEGPYYAFIMTAAAVDTSGGPVIDVDGRITTWTGDPIAGLYGGGNCVASPGVNAYWGGGATLGHAHVWGYQAAKHASEAAEISL
jgi:3-oxosteroid 1-dehydrogenase